MAKQVPLIKTGKAYGASVGSSDNRSPKMSARQVKNEFDKKNQVRDRSFKDNFSVLCLCLGIILSIALIKSLLGSNPITFGGFLEMLASAPSVDMTLKSFEVIPALGDWGAFNFLSTFFNYFITTLNVMIFVFKGVIQVVIYIVWFIRFIF